MARRAQPLFVERSGYRQRRIMDALRLLVILGAGLWMVPVIWPGADAPGAEAVRTSRALFYVFGVWILLIVISAALAFRLKRFPPEADDPDAGP